MEEMEIHEEPGLFSKIAGVFGRTRRVDDYDQEEEEMESTSTSNRYEPRPMKEYVCTVSVRRDIASMQDAMSATNELKSGHLQILNLTTTDPVLRSKIVDFMCGANYALEGTWEEIGESTYIIAPNRAHIQVLPATPQINANRI